MYVGIIIMIEDNEDDQKKFSHQHSVIQYRVYAYLDIDGAIAFKNTMIIETR